MCRWINRAGGWLTLLVVLFHAGCVTSPEDRLLKDFPELRLTDGSAGKLKWSKYDGFDFLVFYGALPGDPSAGVGIYQGGDPQFRTPKNVIPNKGKLGAFDVEWYALTDKGAKFYRTCLFDYQKVTMQRGQKLVTYATKRHVWAYADTEEALNTVLDQLNKLKMFSVWPPDLVQ